MVINNVSFIAKPILDRVVLAGSTNDLVTPEKFKRLSLQDQMVIKVTPILVCNYIFGRHQSLHTESKKVTNEMISLASAHYVDTVKNPDTNVSLKTLYDSIEVTLQDNTAWVSFTEDLMQIDKQLVITAIVSKLIDVLGYDNFRDLDGGLWNEIAVRAID